MSKPNLFLAALILSTTGFFIFSYFWVDFGLILTLSQTREQLNFLHNLRDFGNTNREFLAPIFISLAFILFVLQLIFLTKFSKQFSLKKLLLVFAITTLIFSFSYPFLSHDIFSYMFYSKMVWQYHVNPFTVLPIEFIEEDFALSFTRNVDSTYQYGPISLFYYLIPTILFSGSRIILNFFGIKLLNALVFFLSGVVLYKLTQEKKVFALWFLNPLLIIELLMNSHNDLIMISLFFLAMFALSKKRPILGWLSFLASVLVKYISFLALPAIFLKENLRSIFFKFLCLAIFIYLQIKGGQLWYYTWLYMFLPFLNLKTSSWVLIYLIGFMMVVNYYNFLSTGSWGTGETVLFKSFWINIGIGILVLNESNLLKKRLFKLLQQ